MAMGLKPIAIWQKQLLLPSYRIDIYESYQRKTHPAYAVDTLG